MYLFIYIKTYSQEVGFCLISYEEEHQQPFLYEKKYFISSDSHHSNTNQQKAIYLWMILCEMQENVITK